MAIEFNQNAYDAFKDHFTLYDRPNPHRLKNKLFCAIPVISTIMSIVIFDIIKTKKQSMNGYQSVALVSRGVLSLIPIINLSVLLLQGLGTLVALAIDGVRSQYQIKTQQLQDEQYLD